jgi:hypothetical protein
MDERRIADLMLGDSTADEVLDGIVAELHAPEDPDPNLCLRLGAGDLESLLRYHGEELWPRVELLAREDSRFRMALSGVWAYESAEFERRAELLEELGQHWTITVSFVVEREDFSDPPLLDWRAVDIDGASGGQLPRMLREIADWCERERGSDPG